MSKMQALDLAAFCASLLTSVLVVLKPRLGPSSWTLALFLVPAGLGIATLALGAEEVGWWSTACLPAALAFFVIAAPGGLVFSLTLARVPHEGGRSPMRRPAVLVLYAGAVALAVLLWRAVLLPEAALEEAEDYGRWAVYLGGALLLSSSVLTLASLERMLRSAEEHVRWEIKFLVLGLAVAYGSLVYVASRTLLRPALSLSVLQVFPPVLLVASPLILLGWRRGSGRGGVDVSQSLAFSSLTFLGVGLYLIAASLLSDWAAKVLATSIEAEAVIFLCFALILGTLLLSTSVRHRVRYWLRRNLYAGRYDYRAFWLEATDKIRDSDPPQVSAAAFAELLYRAVGSIDITVWQRDKGSGRLDLLAARGPKAASAGRELLGVKDALEGMPDVSGIGDPAASMLRSRAANVLAAVCAELVVTLRSGGELVGMATVGSDRSGRSFTAEAREFLGVLSLHFAGELHKRELLGARVQAKEDEAFRTFSTFLLHDLKNFASTLSLVAKNASRHESNPDFRRDAFRSVLETAEKMKRICASLRTFSATPAAHRTLADLNRVIESAAATLDRAAGHRLRLELGDLQPVAVDLEEFERVVQNLILNAVEATAAKGEIVVRTRSEGGVVVLEVEDGGAGISPAFLATELFVPFHTTKSHGLGIGLFQSRKIVEAHGGSIKVESEEGRGTVVTVKLPVSGTA